MKVTLPFPSIAEPGAELAWFAGPTDLVRRGLPLPPSSGVYVVASADCVSHNGTSGNLRSRVRSLAALGTHRGSAEGSIRMSATRPSSRACGQAR